MIYQLKSNLHHYPFFTEIIFDDKRSFFEQYANWKPFTHPEQNLYCFELCASNLGTKNYQSDISVFSAPYIIFSEKAINVLKHILTEERGIFFPIQTASKRKKFIAFYPYKNKYPHSVINLDKSDVGYYENGTHQVYHTIFNNNINQNDPLFVVDGMMLSFFVNDEFKQLVEQHDLKGFDFSEIIPIID